MTASQTKPQRLAQLGRDSDALKGVLVRSVEQLDRSEHIPSEIVERLTEQISTVYEMRDLVHPSDWDPEQLDIAYRSLWEMRDLLDSSEDANIDTLDRLLLAVEKLRHVIRDAVDESVPGLADETAGLVQQLREWLPGIPKAELAALLDVTERTLSRWQEQDAVAPNERLLTVAKLVGILRHSWTPSGIVSWFYRPIRELNRSRSTYSQTPLPFPH